MDGDDDHGWDGPNIRPPQASTAEVKSHRPKSAKRDRQVFVSGGASKRGEDRPNNKSQDHRRFNQGDRRHGGEDLRNRLNNRNTNRHRPNEGDRKRERNRQRRPPPANQHPSRSRDPEPSNRDSYSRDEREMRLQRLMNADAAKVESRRDMEVRRQRRALEKEAREAENRVKRKRDRSRDREDVGSKVPRTSDDRRVRNSDESAESGEDDGETEDETESGEDSSRSEEDTASEQSGATPEHNEGSHSEDNEGEVDDEEEESVDSDSDSESSEKKDKIKSGSDHSRSPSKSPTPRRSSEADRESPQNGKTPKEEGTELSPGPSAVVVADEVKEEPPITNMFEGLPPYLPSIYGCRSVEEFQCLNRIEEGTYGVVYRAKDKRTNETVALKRLKMEREKDGFPITSLREINTLLISQHKNVVHVREIVVGSNTDKIFIVMDFVEHDMKALLETMKQKKQVFLPGEVKCLMLQLLSAVAHLHDNWILHRDLKTSNLLLSHNGILKVGDFGLAREYGSPLKPYTAIVVTLWYRAPELLLGIKQYSTFIDVWSIGCIFGEFLRMEPLFPGKSDIEQLNKIYKLLGTPNEKIWPGFSQLPYVQKTKFVDYPVANFRNQKTEPNFPREMLSDQGLNLLRQFLNYDPKQRITCEAALRHPYFDETPHAIDPSMFPTWPAKSEQGPNSGKKAASPKPPSGGGAFKKITDDDDDAHLGYQLNARAVIQPAPAGWNLRF